MNRLVFISVLLTCLASGLAGCSTPAQKLPLNVKPPVTATAGTGVMYLSLYGSQWYEPQDRGASRPMGRLSSVGVAYKRQTVTPSKITVVQIKNKAGSTITKLVLPVSSEDALADALTQELATAGYTVKLVRKLPTHVERGVDISAIYTEMDMDSSLRGRCDLNVKLDTWRNGYRVESRNYKSVTADSSVSDPNILLLKVMQSAILEVTSKAVPDIVHDTAPSLYY